MGGLTTHADPDVAESRGDAAPADTWPEPTPASRPLDRLIERVPPTTALHVLVVVGSALFVWLQLQPHLLLADTTPAGGDMGAHVWGPAFMRDHLLPDFRLTGWTPDWYAGFPAFVFYMVVPMLAIVALDVVLPYGVAFKLITVSGVVMMPVAAYAMGRMFRLSAPGPALMALGTTVFLFDRSFNIYGGNLASTLAGEFAFSISLAISLVFLGSLARALRTGEGRALSAVLLALTALCHLIPAIFAGIGALVMLGMRPDRVRARLVATVGVVGGAVGAFWALPFVWRRPYLNDMGWEKLAVWNDGESFWSWKNEVIDQLLPTDMRWIVALAAAGALASVLLRIRLGTFLAITGLVLVAAFIWVPQGRLWNARLLPFWYLVLHLLAAIAVAEVGKALGGALSPIDEPPKRWTAPVTLGLAALATFVFLGRPLEAVPSWVPVPATDDRSFIDDWARWNYSGYERKDAYPEYHAMVSTMAAIGEERGCGRAMWEYERELDRYGTPMAPMLLPHWTDGCIGSMEGLYFEASATTPYHFINQSELSANPSRPQRGLPYPNLVNRVDIDQDGEVEPHEEQTDTAVFDQGIRHLQLYGVRYYMAFSDNTIDLAQEHPDLTFVGRSHPWEIFEVSGSELVEGLDMEPVVVTGTATGGEEWQHLAIERYLASDGAIGVPVAASGPERWERVPVESIVPAEPDDADTAVPLTEAAELADLADLESDALPTVEVSDIRAGDDSLSFRVDEVGVPVLVKISYFPSWKVSGADGPYRVAPNLMVVVPTSNDVKLTYGWTPVDVLAWLITFAGLAGVGLLVRAGPVTLPVRRRRWTEPTIEPLEPAAAVTTPAIEATEAPDAQPVVPAPADPVPADPVPADPVSPDPVSPDPVSPDPVLADDMPFGPARTDDDGGGPHTP